MDMGNFDLYEFPKDYTGRKTYVTVQGHDKSVPVIYTYRSQGRNRVHPDFGGTWDSEGGGSALIMADIGEYTSTLDGTRITSRSQHRDHMKRYDVIEVGNEKVGRSEERAPLRRPGHDIKRAIEELRSRG